MSAHSRLSPQSDTSPFVVDGFNVPELDSFIDFDLVPPLTSNESLPGKQQILQPTTAATSTSPGQPRSHFGLVGTTNPSQQQHLTPSFPYDLYQQQTGPLPVMYSSASSASSFSSLDLGMGLDVMDGTGMDSLNGASSASANDQGGNDFLDNMEQNTSLYNTPPYFFPETTTNGFSTTQAQPQQAQQAAASALSAPFTKTLPSNAMPIMPGAVLPPGARPYVGMHHDYAVQQQQAILARQKKEQELKAQQLKMAQQPKSKEELERERKIQALLQSIRVEPTPLAPNSAQKVLPHIARLKKEEDEMDEDERLLASEEGKKLTSKERRQLRNKVSARAFRSRRKEYISQLETEVEKKTNETISLQERVRALAQENERLQNLTRTLLQSPAFASFLDTVSGEAFLQQFEAQNGSSNNLRIPPPTDTRSMPKDVNPNVIQASSSSSSDINTAWPLDYNTTTTPMWNANPLVYRATDIPQPSVIQDSFGRAIITEDDYFNPLIATGKDAFSWINFPSPADGFRPSEKEPDVLPEEGCQLLSWAELYSNETGMTEFDPDAIVEYPETDLYLPEDLMDLYEAECGPSVPALSTSVTSSPSSSRSQSVSGLDSILEEEPSSSSAVPRKEKTFDEKDYRRMFLGIAEVIMGERMDLCRPSSSAPSSPTSSSRNPFASTSNTIMVGASLVETPAPAAPKQEKTEFKPIPTEKKEVEVPKMSEEELVHGKVERALEAHLEHVQKVMDRVGRWCGL